MGSHSVGDRVIVHPQSQALEHLANEPGTVEYVYPADKEILGGSLQVRLDINGGVLGIGPDYVSAIESGRRHAD